MDESPGEALVGRINQIAALGAQSSSRFSRLPALTPSGYGSWRRFCGLLVPNTTTELAEILHNLTLAHTFQLLYGTPHNIDVWVGAISEPALPGGRVGPLLACLLSRQFRALRDGDR